MRGQRNNPVVEFLSELFGRLSIDIQLKWAMTLLWNVCKYVCKYVGIGTDESRPGIEITRAFKEDVQFMNVLPSMTSVCPPDAPCECESWI